MRKQSLLLLAWLLLATPAAVKGQFNYTVTNQTVTITGYTGTTNVVVIPSTIDGLPVTSIVDMAFSFKSISGATIPNSVTNIGDGAFYYCTSLTSVTLSNGIIGAGEFQDCFRLSSVTIPNSVTSIGGNAFQFCYGLTNITIPDSVTSIGIETFYGCFSLTNITLGRSITSIGTLTFNSCSNLTSVTIPNSVTSIGERAFASCSSLTNITIPNSVTSIGNGAFQFCSGLADITIPSSVTSIGDYAFQLCTNLTSLHFAGNAPSIVEIVDGINVFLGDKATTYYLAGTSGWGSTYAGLPTAIWALPYPLVLTSTPSFGVQTNGFGFTVSWATNLNVVVEASTNLANWFPVATNALSGGTFHFSDPQWTDYPSRFYRVRSQ